jgi:fructokinase
VADIVCFGELLWDMLPSGKVVGGAPFNISNRARALGLEAIVVTSVGNDPLGDELVNIVQTMGNSIKYIQRHETLPTSTVEITVGEGGEPHYTIVHPVAWDDVKLRPELIELVRNAPVFIYSSLGLRDSRSRNVLFELLKYAQLKVCDINLREGNFTKDTIIHMMKNADVLRMNEYELTMAAQWLGLEIDSFEDGIRKLAAHFDYQCVIATLGSEGAMSYRDGQFYRQPVFKVAVKDTVGAGDAFLASYITQMLKGTSEAAALRFACAVGALTASKNGGTPHITPEEIDDMLSSDTNS